MSKPRIIIADPDFNYIVPLQLKFVEEFFDKVDLEIITDKSYFKELVLSPQSADILVVSEKFYDTALKKHNIDNIFILMEQYEAGETEELNVSRIFKYTSINDIFNVITGKGAKALKIEENKKETQIVLVYSPCGGVGKTTVSLGISSWLAKSYKKVLYINAGRLQSFQRLLDNKSPILAADAYAKLLNADKMIYSEIKHLLRKELFTYLPPFRATLMSIGIPFSVYEKIALSAKNSKEYEYIVIDADSTFDEGIAKLIDIADKVLIVTQQTKSSVYTTNLFTENISGINTGKYNFICNNFNKDEDNALVSQSRYLKFSISDYIEHFNHYDQMKSADFAKSPGMQKIAVLIM